jgi:hypothetical protein
LKNSPRAGDAAKGDHHALDPEYALLSNSFCPETPERGQVWLLDATN